ncbi:MAG TPA: FAD-dependent oxidoreductase [Anaerolineae bacterium]|nr:FAD-dependent oxidoreductase [Anaerolineae bacterium]
MKIAIIGSGVAGLGAAYLLQRQHQVTLFEANDYPGGHVNTITIPEGDQTRPVDTGFIVYNEATYPHLIRLFAELNVPTQPSNMTFSFSHRDHDFEYGNNGLGGFFARRRNLFSPTFWRMFLDYRQLNNHGRQVMDAPAYADYTLGQFLDEKQYSPAFVNYFLLPMASAIWSAPQAAIRNFPLQYLLHFYHNHGVLINPHPVQWRTVTGGSHIYVQKLLAATNLQLHLNTPIKQVTRGADNVTLTLPDDTTQTFDKLVIATHSDQALNLLADPSPAETNILGQIPYEPNTAVLHTDIRFMPRRRAAWAAWNYTMVNGQRPEDPATLTYWMNSLQNLDTPTPYLVTINPQQPVQPDKIIQTIPYAHPAYSLASLTARQQLSQLNGQRHTYYCGAYFGYGFHEDGLKSGVDVAAQLGVTWT